MGLASYLELATEVVLEPTSPFIVDELNHMRGSYHEVDSQIKKRKVPSLKFVTPLMWSHAEYGLALLARYTSQEEASPKSVRNSKSKT